VGFVKKRAMRQLILILVLQRLEGSEVLATLLKAPAVLAAVDVDLDGTILHCVCKLRVQGKYVVSD